MRGEKPVVTCQFDEDGREVREVLLEAFRRFAERELETETPAAAPCP